MQHFVIIPDIEAIACIRLNHVNLTNLTYFPPWASVSSICVPHRRL